MKASIQQNPFLNRILLLFSVIMIWLSCCEQAKALPSFTRQTGMACATCHTQAFGPNLTSYGRAFKLNGYTWGDNQSFLSRFGGLVNGSFTNTSGDNPNDPPTGYHRNNNFAFDGAAAFFGGKIYGPVGAFVQLTYDGVGDSVALDNTDIRIAGESELLGQDFVFGLSLNNSPTVQDLWNTTPAWGYPYISANGGFASTPATGPIISAPIISAVAQQVGGASLYTMINDTVFLEAGAYSSFADPLQKGLGNCSDVSSCGGLAKINGGAPYWRIALQKDWAGHYFSIGHFGFQADIRPNHDQTVADRFTDLGLDFNYQYLANPKHIYEFKASYIREQQQLFATYPDGASFRNQQLGFLGLNAAYTYDQTYGAIVGFNHTYGSVDPLLFGGTNQTARPDSEYWTFELDYIPFGKTASTGWESYLNLRIAAQYIAYNLFNGAINNYDTTFTNLSAPSNNTFYLNGTLSF
jgi:hypothetical protein